MTGTINGIELDRVMATVHAVEKDPGRARSTRRGVTTWRGGTFSTTIVRDHTVKADEPPSISGGNRAASPSELVLAALGACLTITFVYHAALRGIRLHSLEVTVEGDIDSGRFLGVSQEGRPGYRNVRVGVHVESPAWRKDLEDLFSYVLEASPVLDIIRNPVPVSVKLDHVVPAAPAGER